MASYITIDTCVWLNLTLEHGDEVFDALEKLLNEQKVKLLHPEIILDEFERNKEARANEYAAIIKREVKSIKNLFKRFDVLDAAEKAEGHKILDKIVTSEDDIKKLVNDRIERIKNIFSHPESNKIEISNEIYKKVVNRGLNKEAPFSMKNSTADALILEGFASLAKPNDGNQYYFITVNKSDFSSDDDNRQPHSTILEIFQSDNIKFEINIGDVLNTIEQELISEDTVDEIKNWALGDYFSYSCPKCGKEVDNGLSAHPSQFGWTYWAICSSCGHRWNTGEPIDY